MGEPLAILKRCLEWYHEGRIPEAIALAEEGLAQSPDDGGLWQIYGLLRRRIGDVDGARAALETASALMPLDPPARCALADCYALTGKTELAGDLYRQLAGDARCPTALLPAVASGLGSLGDDEAALGACCELARREPGSHEAYFGIGFYLRRLGHPPEAAIPPIARAQELAPGSTLYRMVLAGLLAGIGQREEAYDLLRGVNPRLVGCRCCLRRMMAVFQHAGDRPRLDACRAQAERIAGAQGTPP
ncbi:MAG: tetratricopeptide repeat protein [Isosphaeraceae bacterium]|nr:tetratricopeptide repeat protein [Isosphaeraceae bacterium]